MNTSVFEADYQESWMTRQRCKRLLNIALPHFRGKCVEVGCGIGMFLEGLAPQVDNIVGIDLDSDAVNKSRERCAGLSNVEVIRENGVFLSRQEPNQFDCGFLFHVIEHVEHPRPLLEGIRHVIKPGGLFMAAVPNASSVHRLAGTAMGIISRPNALGPTDREMGHVKVYYPEEFRNLISEYFEVRQVLGTYYKMFPNAVVNSLLGTHRRAMEAVMKVIPHPEHAAEIVVIGRKPDPEKEKV